MLLRTYREVKADRATLLAAAVAFYALLALVPALVATVSLYGLFADPDAIDEQVGRWLGSAPAEVRDLIVSQLENVTGSASAAVSFGAIAGIAVALWSASSGVGHLIEAVNVAYDEEETRGWVRRKAVALAFTIGAVVFVIVAIALIAVVPAALADTGLGTAGRVAAGVLRWALLLVGMLVALAVLYRYGPDRDEPRWRWTSPGALVGTVAWVVASAIFSVYTANFASYNETYGSLGAVVVLMLWLMITALCVIVGAELNAEIESQTARDTTVGQEEPMGERGASAADHLGAAVSAK